jgi:uncharacterized protein YrrD
MKTSQQIIGLPVVSIMDGNEIGRVKALVFNAAKGAADFLVLDSTILSLSGGVVPVGKVLGIGADAVTILQAEDVCAMADVPAAIALLQKNATICGTRILSRKGTLLGVAGDVLVDEDNACAIAGVGFIPGSGDGEIGLIPCDAIITFGGSLLVVEEDAPQRLGSVEACATTAVSPQPKADMQEPVSTGFAPLQPVDTVTDVPAGQEPDISLDGLFGEETAEQGTETLMADRRIQYLRGRRVTRDILGPDAEVVAKAGETIDDALMERASRAGCLVELVMNNEA